jgi:hypothetical protein
LILQRKICLRVLKKWLYEQAPERFRNDHERIESLKQIGTALGPCYLLAALILLWKKTFNPTEFEYAMSRGLLVLGMILILLGWLKVTRQSQYLIDRFNALKSPDTSSLTPQLEAMPNLEAESSDGKEKPKPKVPTMV